ncbi:hypothetical protein ACLMAL_08005 [Nocardia sp. CWNU-33]|uniref:hypothetical protein n=1 Tax=Nocardia sp. CWNU-33 TaxID=3392117 RepID=UPI00398E5C90
MDRDDWRITVQVGGDTLRRERLTRDLRQRLCATDGIDAGFVEHPPSRTDGHKGVSDPELMLWAGVGVASVNAAARVLIAAITQWCGQDRHKKVQLEFNGNSVVLTGKPDDRQIHLVELFSEQITKAPDDRPEDSDQ